MPSASNCRLHTVHVPNSRELDQSIYPTPRIAVRDARRNERVTKLSLLGGVSGYRSGPCGASSRGDRPIALARKHQKAGLPKQAACMPALPRCCDSRRPRWSGASAADRTLRCLNVSAAVGERDLPVESGVRATRLSGRAPADEQAAGIARPQV